MLRRFVLPLFAALAVFGAFLRDPGALKNLAHVGF